MTRVEVLKLCSSARTREEIEKAREARGRYLQDHPDDEAVLEAGGSLEMLSGALDILELEEAEAA